jgi:Exostosin family
VGRTAISAVELRSAAPLNLVWQRSTLDFVLEGCFIKEVLLGLISRPIRTIVTDATEAPPLLDDMLVVSLGPTAADHLRRARDHGCRNIGLFHMGDEFGDQDRSFYRLADYVIRNYWFEEIISKPERSPSVTWVPNGYRNGLGPIAPSTMLPIAGRTVMGFFAGAITHRRLSHERRDMIEAVASAKLPFAIFPSSTEAPYAQSFGPISYAGWLTNSRFGLVPGGNSPETIRLYDTLEAGAIPIMLNTAFVKARDALDNPPFVLLDSWKQLENAYAPFSDRNSPDVIEPLEIRRRAVVNWWADFKHRQQQKVSCLVNRSFESAHPR